MLLNVTCPSCGGSQEASERVLGKEVRCACGARFRVMGSNPSARDDPQRGGSPPWAYAAIGGGAMLWIVVIIILIRSLSFFGSHASNPNGADRVIATGEEPRPVEPAGDPCPRHPSKRRS